MPWIFYPISFFRRVSRFIAFRQKRCLNVLPCSIKNAVAHIYIYDKHTHGHELERPCASQEALKKRREVLKKRGKVLKKVC